MVLDATLKVYIDWDGDGFDANDEIANIIDGTSSIGITTPGSRPVADVGQLSLTLDNADRRYSAGNTGGSYYGKLVPGKAIKVEATVGVNTWRLFTGTVINWQPDSNLYGPRMCILTASDKMEDFQRETDLRVPLQQDATADEILRLIGAAVFQTGAASGTITFTGTPSANDTVTVGSRAYTYKATPSVADEIKVGNPGDAENNLAAAINNTAGEGTLYGTGTDRHAQVVAVAQPSYGNSGQTGTFAVGSGDSDVAQKIEFEGGPRWIDRVRVYIRKNGTPADLTVTIETADSGHPSGTPVDASATATVTAGDVGSSLGWVEVVFAGSFEINNGDFIRLHKTGSEDASNYYSWGNGVSSYTSFSTSKSYSTGSWTLSLTSTTFWIPGTVTIKANARGAWGNAVALADTGTNISVSGAVLSGGADGPSGTLNYDVGKVTMPYVGDQWASGAVNGVTAIEQLMYSEHGLFAINRAGEPTFKNKEYPFRAANDTALVLDNTHSALINPRGCSRDDIYNIINLRHSPRRTLTSGEIARSSAPIRVEPNYDVRYAPYETPGAATVRLPFRDPDTDKPIGALEVTAPVAGSNFTVNDQSDGSGFDYTASDRVKASAAIVGAEVEVTFSNSATGPLFVFDLIIPGVGLVAYDPQTITRQDETSIAAYGRLPQDYVMEIPVQDTFPPVLAEWLLASQKDARIMFDGIEFDAPGEVSAAHLFAVEMFDLLEVSDDQIGIADKKVAVVGMQYDLVAGDVSKITFYTLAVPDNNYWLLGTTGFSELGTSTRLAL